MRACVDSVCRALGRMCERRCRELARRGSVSAASATIANLFRNAPRPHRDASDRRCQLCVEGSIDFYSNSLLLLPGAAHLLGLSGAMNNRDAQLTLLQGQLVAARATQASLQQRVNELERLLGIQQQQQIALGSLGPQAALWQKLIATGGFPIGPNGPIGHGGFAALNAAQAQAQAQALSHLALIQGQQAHGVNTSSVVNGGGSPPQSASPRSSPSPPQRMSPTPLQEPLPPATVAGSSSDTLNPAAQQGVGQQPLLKDRALAAIAATAPAAPPPSHEASSSSCATEPIGSPKQAARPPPLQQPLVAGGASAEQPTAVEIKAEPVHEPPPAAAKNMLELLCTVAGEEERRSPPRNGQPGASHPPPTMLLATPASPESEQRPSANDLLAKAMAGVGAAGSLARIRQQSAAMAGQHGLSPPPPQPHSWHTLDGASKRQKL